MNMLSNFIQLALHTLRPDVQIYNLEKIIGVFS